ncbi:MAG: hypothetical protein QM760_03550 [Nibricoccus sp.]
MPSWRLIAVVALSWLLISCSGPSSSERAEADANRSKILSLVAVGDSLNDAASKLKTAGFSFAYSKPIDPTGRGEYLQQLVLIHPALLKPRTQDTIRYTTGMAPSKTETSPYVIVEASTAGIITKLR